MPRYFFDLIDEGVIQPDNVGMDLPDLAAAVDEAHMRLAEMPLHVERRDRRASLVIQVRDGPDSAVVSVLAPLEHRERGKQSSRSSYQ